MIHFALMIAVVVLTVAIIVDAIVIVQIGKFPYNYKRHVEFKFYMPFLFCTIFLHFLYSAYLYTATVAISLSRLFQRLSLYDLTGFFFFIKFFIQLSLLPFGLPRRKLFLSFFGFKVGLYGGQ